MEPGPSPLLIPVPEVVDGPRVQLRPLRPEDAAAQLEAIEESRAELDRWIGWAGQVRSLDDARENVMRSRAKWLLRERLDWGVFERETGRLLGPIDLHRIDWGARAFEMGYWLRSTALGRGYMREAARVVTRLAFETLHANRVELRIDTRNGRSRALAEGLGYVLEGTLRRNRLSPAGDIADTHIYALTPEDYRRLPWAVDPMALEVTR